MARVKYQVYLGDRSQKLLDALCKQYGWTCSQVVERLLFYYGATRRSVNDLDIDEAVNWGEDDASGCVIKSDPEGYFAPEPITFSESLVQVVEVIKDGLTPLDGFGQGEEENI